MELNRKPTAKLKMSTREDPAFKILLMHGSVTSTQNLVGPAASSNTIGELLSRGLIDCVALGHNHKRWEHQPRAPERRRSDGARGAVTISDGRRIAMCLGGAGG